MKQIIFKEVNKIICQLGAGGSDGILSKLLTTFNSFNSQISCRYYKASFLEENTRLTEKRNDCTCTQR